LAIIGGIIIAIVIGVYYNAEQTRQRGFAFGNELLQIQEELKKLQLDFDSKITIWKEGDITKDEFLEYSNQHIEKMQRIVEKYDDLSPPMTFRTSVDLFKVSTETQLESDRYVIQWIETEDKAASIRSDSLLQEAFEYELAALSEFNRAKAGISP